MSPHFLSRTQKSWVNRGIRVSADTAYRSQKHEAWLKQHGFLSEVDEKKPSGKTMPDAMRERNRWRSLIRARVEHVFAHQKYKNEIMY